MHVDPLDRATGLAAVEERAVGEVLDGMLQIGVRAYVGGILAAKLQADREKAARSRFLHALSAGHRAGEAHEVDLAAVDDAGGRVVAEVQVLEHARGQPARGKRLGHALGAQRRLRRVLQDDGVAGHQRGHDAVHRRQIRVVPGRNHERHAKRDAANEPREPGLFAHLHVGQRLIGHGDHVAGALFEPAHLVRRVADRPAHLPGELGGDLVPSGNERVDGPAQGGRALRDRNPAPLRLGSSGPLQRGGDLAIACQRPLDIRPAVNRRDHPDPVAHHRPRTLVPGDDRMRCGS